MASLPAKQTVPATWAVVLAAGRTASVRFWVCLALLVVAAVGLQTAATRLGIFLRKEAVPLRTSLHAFDARKLGPEYALNEPMMAQRQPMTEDMVDSLGTDEYLQVYLTDTRKPGGDPTAIAQLFVTYYTGKPDLVPHVPDECWLAGGYEHESEATITLRVPGVGAPDDALPVRVLEFRARRADRFLSAGPDVATVAYLFHANGHYATTRNGVRALLSNPFARYAYYSKVEVTFLSQSGARADKQAAIDALPALLGKALPVLLRDHFDLRKFPDAAPAGSAGP